MTTPPANSWEEDLRYLMTDSDGDDKNEAVNMMNRSIASEREEAKREVVEFIRHEMQKAGGVTYESVAAFLEAALEGSNESHYGSARGSNAPASGSPGA